ncbi:MAG TPA: hypothetical protein PLP59_12345 [Thermotogota bacterium]|nr:hypothetical protein [Thermotogota bacterium]HQN23178.1 hypothetical protein [Thermotogota bacterium]HQQ66952.1 hypothetical protein [Thermotogota bacterium]
MAESVLDSLIKKADELETTKAVTVNADVSDAQSKIERLASTLESVAKKAEDLAKNTLDVGNSIKTWKSAEDLVTIFNDIVNAGLSAGQAMTMLVDAGFDDLRSNADLMASYYKKIFGEMGDNIAKSLGVASNALDIATLDDDIESLSNKIMSVLADMGMGLKEAEDKVKKMNFSPLEKSADEAAAEIYKALTSAGYTSEEALKELNNLGFENVTGSLEKLGVALGNVGAEANTEGIDKLKASLSDFPDASGIFEGIDFDAVNEQFTNISNAVVGINVALKDVNDNLGDFQQKAQDASGDMVDLVENLRKMSVHSGALKANLEDLTSKTWTINVVYKETKQ